MLLALAPVYGSTQQRVMPNDEQAAATLEQRYANALPANQFQRLNQADGPAIPALYLEQTTAASQGGALILHDSAQHPDWPRIVHELRTFLPDAGWSTLSISLPPPPPSPVPRRSIGVDEPVIAAAAPAEPLDEAHYQALRSRMAAGIRELTGRGLLNLVIVGIGSAALPATRYASDDLNAGNVDNIGLILIDTPYEQSTAVAAILEDLSVRMLDVYTAGAHADQAAAVRRAASRRNPDLQGTQVREQAWLTPLRGGPQPIVRRAWGWLRTNMAGAEREVEVDGG